MKGRIYCKIKADILSKFYCFQIEISVTMMIALPIDLSILL